MTMTDDKTKQKAIEAAADIFGISFFLSFFPCRSLVNIFNIQKELLVPAVACEIDHRFSHCLCFLCLKSFGDLMNRD